MIFVLVVHVRTGLLLRITAGLLIAAPMVFRVATADLAGLDHGQRKVSPSRMISTAGLMTVGFKSPVDKEHGEPTLLSPALASERWELLWTARLPMSGRGNNTVRNVQLAAEAVDFTVVQPYEIFSYNDIVGRRSEEKGYQPGMMYTKGELVTGIGGGVCILSTFLYNAALESGLKIIERHPHSGPVAYAPPGRDAAVSYGWADLRFKNNTGHSLLLRAKADDRELVVSFYGVKTPGRTVEIVSEDYEEIPYKIFEKEDPTIPEGELKVEQKARAGFAATTVRLIKQDGKLVSREVISRDTILPKHKVILIPPKPDPVDATQPPDALEPMQAAPSSGTIRLQETEDQSEVPISRDAPGLNLPTSERTTSTASE